MSLRRPSASLLVVALAALAASGCATTEPAAAPAKMPAPVASSAPMPSAPAAKPAAPAPAAVVERPAAFGICAACHGTTANAPPGLGPNLVGVAGKKAGTVHPDYDYSDALKKSGKIWTPENLAAFLVDPAKSIPDNNMDYPGVPDAATAKVISEYMATLK